MRGAASLFPDYFVNLEMGSPSASESEWKRRIPAPPRGRAPATPWAVCRSWKTPTGAVGHISAHPCRIFDIFASIYKGVQNVNPVGLDSHNMGGASRGAGGANQATHHSAASHASPTCQTPFAEPWVIFAVTVRRFSWLGLQSSGSVGLDRDAVQQRVLLCPTRQHEPDVDLWWRQSGDLLQDDAFGWPMLHSWTSYLELCSWSTSTITRNYDHRFPTGHIFPHKCCTRPD